MLYFHFAFILRVQSFWGINENCGVFTRAPLSWCALTSLFHPLSSCFFYCCWPRIMLFVFYNCPEEDGMHAVHCISMYFPSLWDLDYFNSDSLVPSNNYFGITIAFMLIVIRRFNLRSANYLWLQKYFLHNFYSNYVVL